MHFVENPLFDTLTTRQKNISHPYTLLVIVKLSPNFNIAQKMKNLGPIFDPTLDQFLTQKKPNLGTNF